MLKNRDKSIIHETNLAASITQMVDYLANVAIQKKMFQVCHKLSNEIWALNNSDFVFKVTKNNIKNLLTQSYKLVEYEPFS